jgi:predicted nucleic-acid-binding protein
MIAIDTNVLARFYIAETQGEAVKQHALAAQVMAQQQLFVPRTVLLELEWVMRGGYGYPREEIFDVFEHLLALPNVRVENWDMVSDAVAAYGEGADFADALHHAAAKAASSQKLMTFDQKFSKKMAKLKRLPPVQVIS